MGYASRGFRPGRYVAHQAEMPGLVEEGAGPAFLAPERGKGGQRRNGNAQQYHYDYPNRHQKLVMSIFCVYESWPVYPRRASSSISSLG